MGAAPQARLVLEDGSVFGGRLHGAARAAAGEVVFNTGMVGYTEALTDPSYRGQILALTYPLVGNYGVPPDFESERIQASALVVTELAEEFSHWRAAKGLPQWLEEQGIPCLSGVDTRALTRRLRARGSMLGKLVFDDCEIPFDNPDERDLVAEVASAKRIVYPGGDRTVLVVDCGCKASIVENLRARGLTVIRVGAGSDFLREDFDALLVSNGPGDPARCADTVAHLRRALAAGKPIFGICLGHQLLALAAGASTYKLKYGHRGHNQPCVEVGRGGAASGRCFITSQNHGYAVDAATLPAGWEAWFTNANDGSNEGMRHVSRPLMSVQFHPEAAPGPVDCASLFDEFVSLMR